MRQTELVMPYRSPQPSVRHLAASVLFLPLMLAALLVIAPIALVLRVLGRDKLRVGPEYVLDHLERFRTGQEGEYDWDDFCSVPIEDDRLEAIREQACRFAPPAVRDDRARAELCRLMAELQGSSS